MGIQGESHLQVVRSARARGILGVVGVVMLLLVAMVPAAGAEPRGIIWDPSATPSWGYTVIGFGASSDAATDVKLSGRATYFCGTAGNAAGNDDITLTKMLGAALQWTVRYDGAAHQNDRATKMALSPDGKSVYVTGYSVNAAGNPDLVVIRRSTSSGALKWVRRYNGPGHGIDIGRAIGVDAAGNVTAAGYSQGTTSLDCVAVSYTASGARRWVWRYDGAGHGPDIVHDALVKGDGTVYLTGMGMISGGKQAAITARISKRGTKVWLKTYTGPGGLGAGAMSLAARPGGGIYIAGAALGAATATDGMVVRYTASGARDVFVLDVGPGGASDQMFNDVAVTSTGAVVAAGGTTLAGNDDCRVMIYRPDGTVVTSASLPGAWDDHFYAVATDAFGGYYLVGTNHVAAGDCKILTVRGTMLAAGGGWVSQWGPTVSAGNIPAAVAVRATSLAIVGQYASGGASGIDQVLQVYTY